MKKTLFFLALLLLTATTLAQKIKIKDNIAYVDGVSYLKWDKRAATEISVSGIASSDEEIYVMYLDYTDPNKITKSNPRGEVSWIELNFLTLQKKCEISTRAQRALVKFLYENAVYVNDVLSAQNVDKLVAKYGMRYSEARPGGRVNIYINE